MRSVYDGTWSGRQLDQPPLDTAEGGSSGKDDVLVVVPQRGRGVRGGQGGSDAAGTGGSTALTAGYTSVATTLSIEEAFFQHVSNALLYHVRTGSLTPYTASQLQLQLLSRLTTRGTVPTASYQGPGGLWSIVGARLSDAHTATHMDMFTHQSFVVSKETSRLFYCSVTSVPSMGLHEVVVGRHGLHYDLVVPKECGEAHFLSFLRKLNGILLTLIDEATPSECQVVVWMAGELDDDARHYQIGYPWWVVTRYQRMAIFKYLSTPQAGLTAEELSWFDRRLQTRRQFICLVAQRSVHIRGAPMMFRWVLDAHGRVVPHQLRACWNNKDLPSFQVVMDDWWAAGRSITLPYRTMLSTRRAPGRLVVKGTGDSKEEVLENGVSVPLRVMAPNPDDPNSVGVLCTWLRLFFPGVEPTFTVISGNASHTVHMTLPEGTAHLALDSFSCRAVDRVKRAAKQKACRRTIGALLAADVYWDPAEVPRDVSGVVAAMRAAEVEDDERLGEIPPSDVAEVDPKVAEAEVIEVGGGDDAVLLYVPPVGSSLEQKMRTMFPEEGPPVWDDEDDNS